MFTSQNLATLVVRRVIFHDVPSPSRTSLVTGPVLADLETAVDPPRTLHLRRKLTQVIGSKSAYPILFNPQSASPVPALIRAFTKKHHPSNEFVSMSQTLAKYLFEQQNGSISPGLLCVLDVAIQKSAGLVLMKLEREEGAQLELTSTSGKKSFAMAVLDNLVLTDGTRLFKTAAFLRTGTGDDDFTAAACDAQHNVVSSDDVAKFWLRFLGCMVVEEPRVATQRFYESALRFINGTITDPIVKNDVYEHLHSQLKAEKRQFSPRSFIEDFVPSDFQAGFRDHLKDERIALTAFPKDLADIAGRLRRYQYRTPKGAVLTVPSDETGIVEVRDEQIVVNDRLLSVDQR